MTDATPRPSSFSSSKLKLEGRGGASVIEVALTVLEALPLARAWAQPQRHCAAGAVPQIEPSGAQPFTPPASIRHQPFWQRSNSAMARTFR